MAEDRNKTDIDDYNSSLKDFASECWHSSTLKLSETCRKVVWALLGSIWIMFFTSKEDKITPNQSFALSFVGCVAFLVFEVIQYIATAIFYYIAMNRIDKKYYGAPDYLKDELNKLDSFSCWSIIFVIIKVVIIIGISVCFFIGIFNTDFLSNIS